ncbi:cysteine desulfurylase [Thecamonas trahens ATCC 50062]|uniref:cysteine desulfurase n=1 Tax=Thecamonas trahens ATCC 50062 TaxID=461836 RepID=A0A0L0DNJ2_THETB|nr:cysteine desulfurylase [Thecamonas trahens ATCC 50062]KNC53884.1 cysteine desulfurylase [Thecamonas trahens ATCC 50062]|eukprot:XP_013754260.1 cysteine desulfurylase [Thecamonas trahens ATCC 50062]
MLGLGVTRNVVQHAVRAGAVAGGAVRWATATAAREGTATEPKPVYLDYAATTPMDPRVLDAMLPHMVENFGNSGSRTHAYGWESEDAVEEARASVAELIGASPKDIVFTSGATESNNIAVKGVPRFYSRSKKHVITTQIEHKCVLDSCRALEREGFDVTYLPVQTNGLIDMAELEASIRDDTALISIMAVNNEIGVTQPIADIGALAKSRKVFFHTDAAQMFGKMPINVDDMNIDLLSISSHKIYGPKGVGALYVRRRPRARHPLWHLPTDLVVGLGAAAKVASEEMAYDSAHVAALSERLTRGILDAIPEVEINGDPVARYPGLMNYSFAYVEGESLLMALKDIAISSGSACTSASLEPSYVLRSLQVSEDLAHSSLRVSLSRFSTVEEVDHTIALLKGAVERLRDMSPLWELVQEGVDLSTIKWTADH